MSLRPDDVTIEYRRGNCNELDRETGAGGTSSDDWPSWCYSANGLHIFALQLTTSGADLWVFAVDSAGAITVDVGSLTLSGGHAINQAKMNLVLSADGSHLYIADGDVTIYAIDVTTPTSPTEADTVTIDGGAGFCVLLRDGTTLYAFSFATCKKIDISTPSTLTLTFTSGAITGGDQAIAGAITPDGDYLYFPSTLLSQPMAVVDLTGANPVDGTPIDVPQVEDGSGPFTTFAGAPIFVDADFGVAVASYIDEVSFQTRYIWLVLDGSGGWDTPEVLANGYESGASFIDRTTSIGLPEVANFPEHAAAYTAENGYVHMVFRNELDNRPARLATWELIADGLTLPNSVTLPYPRLVSSVEIQDVYDAGKVIRNGGGIIALIGPTLASQAGFEVSTLVVTLMEPQGWTDISWAVLAEPGHRLAYGIGGSRLSDRVANTGALTFALDNSQFSQSGALGKFSPDHASVSSDFRAGQEVRLTVTYDGGIWRWYGWIESIRPTPGLKLERRSVVTCVDAMDVLARAKSENLRLQVEDYAYRAFLSVIALMRPQPQSLSVVLADNTDDVFPFVFDRSREEEVALVSEIQKIAVSSRALVYIESGALTYEGRSVRTATVTPSVTLDDSKLSGLVVERSTARVVNRARVSVYPRTSDDSDVVLFTYNQADHKIAPGASLIFNAPYKDPDQRAQRVGAISLVAPVATTDYQFFSSPGGAGTDLTTKLTVGVEQGANSAKIIITNTGALEGYLFLFQLRGKGLYSFEPSIHTVEDKNSRDVYGLSEESYNMPYHGDPTIAEDAAQFLVGAYKAQRTFADSALVILNNDADLLSDFANLAALTISDRITVTESVTGVSTDYFVQGLALEITDRHFITATLPLVPAVLEQAWLLEDAVYGLLDQTTILGSGFLS